MFAEGERRGSSPDRSCQSTTQGGRVLRGERRLPFREPTAFLLKNTQTLQMLVRDDAAAGPRDSLQLGDVGFEHGGLLVGCAISAHVNRNFGASETDKFLANGLIIPESRRRGVLDHDAHSTFPTALQKSNGAVCHRHTDPINMASYRPRGSSPAPTRTRCSEVNHPDEATTYPSVNDVDDLRFRHVEMRPVEEVDGDRCTQTALDQSTRQASAT